MSNKNKWQPVVIVLTMALLVTAGCSTHKPIDPTDLAPDLPGEFSNSGSVEPPDKWWEAFGNQELNSLIEQGLGENLDILQAWARLKQADALLASASADKLPQLNFNGSGRRTRNSDGPVETVDSWSGTATVSYEVDLWNRISASEKSSLYSYQATRMDVETMALSLSSSIANVWLSIVEQKQIIDLLNKQLDVNQEYLKLVELRFSKGQASAIEVFQQRQQVAATESEFPGAEASLKILSNSLAILLGKAPGDVTVQTSGSMPALPLQPDTGIPADVIAKRPDVASRELMVRKADQDLAVSKARLYPTFSLSSSAGSDGDSISSLLDSWFASLTGNLLAPVFDGGSRRADVSRNQAVLEERLLAWKSSLLVALREVEDALINEEGQVLTLAAMDERIELAEHTLERSRNSYVKGLTSYLNVLNSLQSLQTLQISHVRTQKTLLQNRIDLYLALGGNWTSELVPQENEFSGQK